MSHRIGINVEGLLLPYVPQGLNRIKQASQ